MKSLLTLIAFIACMTVPLRAGTQSVNERLAGKYLWIVPGSTWTLSLDRSGTYSLTTKGAFEKKARPIESGTWLFEEFTLLLKSGEAPVGGTGGEYRKLHVLRNKNGELILVSAIRVEPYMGQPVGSETLFAFVFVPMEVVAAQTKKEANQTLEPTPSGRGSP